MSREVCLLVFQQRNVPARWSMSVPKTGSAVEGKIIHVISSPFTGYGLEIKRNYDLSRTSRKYTKMVLGQVDNSHIKDVEGTENTTEIEVYDDLENEAKLVQAPVPLRWITTW
ncbi:hypothetical protein Plec18167_004003 [Paecilomyces lecythidis]|uniref:Uncharacterized protein n=1 Tax=Paecilomyces lecythidis TaxID=3004212 RepID=A0ABR3XU73_9EURO